ncbi:MAG: FKBP-type peptidyl-prolyl cis-trans isomerase [Chloracidobacterium sp.]|nr:FKBP-type peptidyl-prolyl cis-trans isomerase [Chloracidobacterium sp.]MDW8218550.1 FKBP-type peptidyl-prolyl cis-trans isomerase [Acidobacteriota bacterium]
MANLAIENIRSNEGASAGNGKVLAVHHTGQLMDGTNLDGPYDRRRLIEPALGLGEVICGWALGVVGWQVSGKQEPTIIPLELAYGIGVSRPPHSTLR